MLEEYGYEIRFQLLDDCSTADENAAYKECEEFAKQLNKRLRAKRATQRLVKEFNRKLDLTKPCK